MTCLADVTREYKRAKADSLWPVKNGVVDPQAEVRNPCFGKVTALLKAEQVPEWGGTSTELRVEWTCSRCKSPFVAKRPEIDAAVLSGSIDVERLADWIGE